MKALVQRVSSARVEVDAHTIGQIGLGLLVLLCAERGDTRAVAGTLLNKLLKLRIFADDAGKMNRSVQDLDGLGTPGGLLVVSQFTLVADTSGGNRPSFGGAAPPAEGRELYEHFVELAKQAHPIVQTGQFGAHMAIHLVNDGPVTIPMQVSAQGTAPFKPP